MSGRRDLETIGVDDGSQPESTPSPNTKAPSPVTLESLPLAEACLSMWQVTNQENYRLAVTRWAQAIQTSLSEQAGHGSRSEEYGRAIHFLARASDAFQQPQWRKVAEQIADDAMSALYEPRLGMFRSRTGSDRCDAMDGPGFLLLALLYLDGPDPTAESALHF